MKDFEKTISLVRDFNGFCDIVSMLRHNDKFKLSDRKIEALTDDMKKYCDRTYCRGDELADEVKDVCHEVMDLKRYVSIWESLLDGINTAWMEDEEAFKDDFWKARIGDYHTCQMFGLLSNMRENYINVKDSVWNLKNSYGLNEYEAPIFTDQEEESSVEGRENKSVGATVIPHDVLRLFGHSKDKYQEYINACKDQCPKEIARLYKKYGSIQLSKENGIVTTLYDHLCSLGLLTCGKRNFQQHYSQV